jgi:hypothetical protein
MNTFTKILQARLLPILAPVLLSGIGQVAYAEATQINWADWQNSASQGVSGIISTPTADVVVNYTNLAGMAFVQLGNDTNDYWQKSGGGRNPATSPYTSEGVANIPTGTDLIALRYEGSQTLSFSETVANLAFSYVSLNGNGYAFDQDFEILSFGDASDGNDCGYWGCGTSFKNVVTINGTTEYQLLGTGEPHGTIRFLGSFDSISWRSLSNEYWNGFTVGIQGTEAEVAITEGFAECEENSRNHGQYTSCIAHLLNGSLKAGDITEEEKGLLQSIAAKSDVGKPAKENNAGGRKK